MLKFQILGDTSGFPTNWNFDKILENVWNVQKCCYRKLAGGEVTYESQKPETGNCSVSLSAACKLRSIFNFKEKNEVFSTKWNKYESVG